MTKIKICGITNVEDAVAAAKAGADYLGFVVDCPTSPRSVSTQVAAEICKKIRAEFPHIRCVGVLEKQNYDELTKIISTCLFDIAQVSDELPPNICSALRPHAEVWKSVIVKNAADIARGESFRKVADKILYDAGKGSGKIFDHNLLAGVCVDIIAGGISPDNVKNIITKLNPEIVDVNSKIEVKPGIKSHELIKRFFLSLRGRSLATTDEANPLFTESAL